MKKLLLIVVAVCGLAACKKSNVKPALNGSLIGTWELHSRTGGNIIPADTTYKPGNGNTLQLNADSTYKSYTNGVLAQSGVFHTISVVNFAFDASPIEYIYFDSAVSSQSEIKLAGTTLTFLPFMPDIGTTVYNKIAD